jgi:hypothetical protein
MDLEPPLWLTLLPYGPPVAAIVVCVVCRRHRVLLWLGGLVAALPIGALAGLIYVGCRPPADWHPLKPRTAEPLPLYLAIVPNPTQEYMLGLVGVMFLSIIVLPAALILLVGGLVRWGLARRRGRRAPASEPVEPTGDPEPGSPPDG